MGYFHNLSNFLCYFPDEIANVHLGNMTVSQSRRHAQGGYKSDTWSMYLGSLQAFTTQSEPFATKITKLLQHECARQKLPLEYIHEERSYLLIVLHLYTREKIFFN